MLEELPKEALGSRFKPVFSEGTLHKAMEGRQNCYIYTKGTLLITKSLLEKLQTQNIILIGENYLKLHKKIENTTLNGTTDLIPKGILVDILKGQKIKEVTSFKPNNLTKIKINREFKFDELHELKIPEFIEEQFYKMKSCKFAKKK